MFILGIETSCDETSASVVEDGTRMLSNVISSQVDLHAHYGGVVPELASRRHLERIVPVVDQALSQAGVKLSEVDAIAVTHGPGLMGALLVGLSAAKGLAMALDVPLVGVNHLEAHMYAAILEHGEPQKWPVLALVVSGGHSDLVLMMGHGQYQVLGRTRDDAAGEAFDKTARALGLPFPGGPEIDRLSHSGDPRAITFPRAYLEEGSLDFSFSGLKTAVVVYLKKAEAEGSPVEIADVAASFQQAVVDVLIDKTLAAAHREAVTEILLVGGVAANSCLRESLADRAGREGITVRRPGLLLCTDNAAMIACAGYYRLVNSGPSQLSIPAVAGLDLDSWGSG